MADILVALIDSELMDIIIAQFLDKNVVCIYPIPSSARRHSAARYHSSFYP
jgi:hypothetical protein